MAAGDNIAVTNVTMAKPNTLYSLNAAFTANAATATAANATQTWTFTPTKADSKCIMIIRHVGAGGASSYVFAVGANGFKGGTLTLAPAAASTYVAQLDGKYKNAAGAFVVVATPYTGEDMLDTNAATVAFVELF
jgi:hypothetical protein